MKVFVDFQEAARDLTTTVKGEADEVVIMQALSGG